MYISLEQALKVYDLLIEAKITEQPVSVIVSKLLPYNPFYLFSNFGMGSSEDMLTEKKAAEDFHSLCSIFQQNHNVNISIDGIEINEWINQVRTSRIRFYNFVKVKVEKKQ